MTGKINCSELGGLYKNMPTTCLFYIIGALSISAFPLTCGFISKSMIISAAGHDKLTIIWLILQFASAGVFHHAGIKVPYFTFFSHDSGIRTKEPPLNMLFAMGIAAFLCVFLAIFPAPLYNILPYPVDYVPYTGAHVVGQLQLLMFGALAFCLLILSGYYPAEMRAMNLDVDWFYRKGGRLFYYVMDKGLNGLNRISERVFVDGLAGYLGRVSRDGSARAALLALVPAWVISGAKGEKLAVKKANVHSALRTGTSPIGITVAISTVFIVVMFFLM
jgi:multicomponent Na+:H+ antiporter subunit D